MDRDDEVFAGVEQLLRTQARSVAPMPIRAATHEQVDLVVDLQALSRAVTEHCRQVLMAEPASWADLADALQVAARMCRSQVVVDVDHEGGDGTGHR